MRPRIVIATLVAVAIGGLIALTAAFGPQQQPPRSPATQSFGIVIAELSDEDDAAPTRARVAGSGLTLPIAILPARDGQTYSVVLGRYPSRSAAEANRLGVADALGIRNPRVVALP